MQTQQHSFCAFFFDLNLCWPRCIHIRHRAPACPRQSPAPWQLAAADTAFTRHSTKSHPMLDVQGYALEESPVRGRIIVLTPGCIMPSGRPGSSICRTVQEVESLAQLAVDNNVRFCSCAACSYTCDVAMALHAKHPACIVLGGCEGGRASSIAGCSSFFGNGSGSVYSLLCEN